MYLVIGFKVDDLTFVLFFGKEKDVFDGVNFCVEFYYPSQVRIEKNSEVVTVLRTHRPLRLPGEYFRHPCRH
jgi:hypothetical protein